MLVVARSVGRVEARGQDIRIHFVNYVASYAWGLMHPKM